MPCWLGDAKGVLELLDKVRSDAKPKKKVPRAKAKALTVKRPPLRRPLSLALYGQSPGGFYWASRSGSSATQ